MPVHISIDNTGSGWKVQPPKPHVKVGDTIDWATNDSRDKVEAAFHDSVISPPLRFQVPHSAKVVSGGGGKEYDYDVYVNGQIVQTIRSAPGIIID